MTEKPPTKRSDTAQTSRKVRLKKALQANLARRKAQTRARGGQGQNKQDRQG